MRKQASIPHKRDRVVRVLLLPAAVILWLIGWSFYWISSRRQLDKSINSNHHEDDDALFTAQMSEPKHAK